MIEWKWVIVGVAIGAGVGFFMGQKSLGGRFGITGSFAAPYQAKLDRGA
jgi:hypothetical protein